MRGAVDTVLTRGGVRRLDPMNTTGDRLSLWVPLLVELTNEVPGWLVWKNAESALYGLGDIDAAAPQSDWPTIERIFCKWAARRGLGPVVICRHIPGGVNLVALPKEQATFLEMGVKARRIWRGSTLFLVDDLFPMATVDPLGFRRLRPGAEGLFKLFLNGTHRDGTANEVGLRQKRVVELLRADPEGVRQASVLFGPGRRAAVASARAVRRGDWDRRSVLAAQSWMLLRAFRNPGVLVARIRFRLRGSRECPVVRAILTEGRRMPQDLGRWLERVALDHEIRVEAGTPTWVTGPEHPSR